MQNLRHPLFLLSAFAYAFLKLSQKLGYHFPFFHDHLADFLCMPVVLSLAVTFMRWTKKDKNYVLNPLQIVVATVLYAFLFEFLFPMLSTKATSDWRDVIAYCLGALVFVIWMNKQPARSNN